MQDTEMLQSEVQPLPSQLFTTIRRAILSKLDEGPDTADTIRGLWIIDCLFQPDEMERVFDYVFLVAQTVLQGAAYSFDLAPRREDLLKLIGRRYRDLSISHRALEIALLDAIWASHKRAPHKLHELVGSPTLKAKDRAAIVASETLRLVEHVSGRRPRVTNIGAVGNVVTELHRRDCDVRVVDLHPSLVGQTLHGVDVEHGDHGAAIVEDSDAVVITGMTLTNGSLDELLDAARTAGCRTVIFAETGSSFAEFYLDAAVDCVVAEPFPFYIYQGKTEILVYRRARS